MTIAKMISNRTATLFKDGKVFTCTNTHPSFDLFCSYIEEQDYENAINCLSVKKAMTLWSEGRFEIREEGLFLDGELAPVSLSKKVIAFFEEKKPFGHLLRFLERLSENPSYSSIESLYDFLENKNIPIDEDGFFYAYKSITLDWKDIYSKSISNEIGATPRMKRSSVDDNRNHHCSKGLHVGSLEYVKSYGGPITNKRIVICKVDPADVVSVPLDHYCQKVRVTSYEVIAEFTGPLPETSYDNNFNDYWDDEDTEEDDYWEQDDFENEAFADSFEEVEELQSEISYFEDSLSYLKSQLTKIANSR